MGLGNSSGQGSQPPGSYEEWHCAVEGWKVQTIRFRRRCLQSQLRVVSENGWTVVLQPVGAALVQGRALQNFYHPGWTIEPGFRLDRRGPERNTLGSYKGRAPLPAERRSTGTVRIEGFILTRYSCGLSGPEGQHLDWHKPGSPQSTKWRWPKHLRS